MHDQTVAKELEKLILRMERLEKVVEKMSSSLFGNGGEGISGKVREHDTFLNDLKSLGKKIILVLVAQTGALIWFLLKELLK